jgi:ribosomal RNA methyltransferase Nop2
VDASRKAPLKGTMVATRSRKAPLKGTLSAEAAQPSSSEDDEAELDHKMDLLGSENEDEEGSDDGDSDSDEDGEDDDEDERYRAAAGTGAYSDSSDDEPGGGEEMAVVRKARQLDEQAARDELADADELRQQQAGLLAPDSDDDMEDEYQTEKEKFEQPVDLEVLLQRIHETVITVEKYKTLPEEQKREKPRSEYLQQLIDDCATYYGYLPFLIGKFMDIFSPTQAVEFLQANETDRPVTIRANTLKT